MTDNEAVITVRVDMQAAYGKDLEAVDAAIDQLKSIPHVTVEGWGDEDRPEEFPECERHGGPWGGDETCPACTDEDGKPLAYHAGPDAQRGVR